MGAPKYKNKLLRESDKTSVAPSNTLEVNLAAAKAAPPAILMLTGPKTHIGRQWFLDQKNKCTIGRDENSTICLCAPSVSNEHAIITVDKEEQAHIVDLGSTNKTMIDDKVLEPHHPYKLKDNDRIQMGNVIFKFSEKGSLESVSAAQSYGRSMTDELTGIKNRRAFEIKSREYFSRSEALAAPLTLITFDIDHFKKINDTYGHAAGDYILIELSQIIKSQVVRNNDLFARTGGEEFCVLLVENNTERVKQVGERIRTTIENQKFNFEGQEIPVTLSVGIAIKNEQDVAWQEFFKRADKALYCSKNEGRNRVSLDE